MVPQQLQCEWLLHHGLTFLGEQPQLQSDRAAEGAPSSMSPSSNAARSWGTGADGMQKSDSKCWRCEGRRSRLRHETPRPTGVRGFRLHLQPAFNDFEVLEVSY